jgi:alkylhydroperoxidase family enzyme
MTRDDVEHLRATGFTDEDIHDITQIAAYFNYINRVADALGIPPEPEMRPWAREDGRWD